MTGRVVSPVLMLPVHPRLGLRRLRAGLVAALLATAAIAHAAAPDSAARTRSKFVDPVDGWFDLSTFLDEPLGFAPFALPITEPAVGYGAAFALVFMNPSQEGNRTRPDLTAAGGLATENGTWGGFALDSRSWMDERLQTIVVALYAELQLDYYGLGESDRLRDQPLSYQLAPAGGRATARYRLGESRAKVGLAYTLARTEVEFDAASGDPALPSFDRHSWLGGVTPSFSYDTRNALFTPTRGIFVETMLDLYGNAFGGSDDFQRADAVFIGYYPAHPRVTLGARTSTTASFNDAPFIMRPYVYMRGIAAMRYQGEQVAQLEAEVRYQFWKRLSVVGFGGIGATWAYHDSEAPEENVEAFGAGVRYELARRYALHVGVDVARGPDETAIYVQFGSAWMRL